jgi:hypothetical protein
MAIKVLRNDQGNCVQFGNSTNPVYWNACLRAVQDSTDPSLINIINDSRTDSSDSVIYEFYNIPYTEFVDGNEIAFTSVESAVEYINNSSKSSNNVNTVWLGADGYIDFSYNSTEEYIVTSYGDFFPINSVTAVKCFRGNISVVSSVGTKVYYTNGYQSNITINGEAVSSFRTEAIAQLNAHFTKQPYGNVIPDPVVFTSESSATMNYSNGVSGLDFSSLTDSSSYGLAWTSEVAETVGEGFEVLGFNNGGSYVIGVSTLTDAELSAYSSVSESDLSTIFYAGALYSSDQNAIKSYYGFAHDRMQDVGAAGDDLTISIDMDGKFRIQNQDGVNSVRGWVELPTDEYRLVIASVNPVSFTDVNYISSNSDTLVYHYFVESPDGVFNYPLFKTEAEANLVDSENGGSGTSTTRTFIDEPTNTTFYSPDTGYTSTGSSYPTSQPYARVSTDDDVNYIPSISAQSTTVVEGTSVSYAVVYSGTINSSSVTNLPSGMVYNSVSHTLSGTAPSAGTYTITVTVSNAFGSASEDITLTSEAGASFNSTKALSISGSYNHGSVMTSGTSHPFYSASDDFTVGFWFKSSVSSISSTKYILRGYSSNDAEVSIKLDSSERLVFEVERNGYGYLSYDVSSYLDNNWHLITWSFTAPATTSGSGYISSGVSGNWVGAAFDVRVDGTSLSHYNGYESGTYTVGNSAYDWGSSSVNELHWFNLADGFGYAPAGIMFDDIFVYGSALSSAQVTTAYNSGEPTDMESIDGTNLYWYWRMGDNTDTAHPTIVDTKGNNNFIMENMSATNIVNR